VEQELTKLLTTHEKDLTQGAVANIALGFCTLAERAPAAMLPAVEQKLTKLATHENLTSVAALGFAFLAARAPEERLPNVEQELTKLATRENLTPNTVTNIAFGFRNLAERAPAAMLPAVEQGLTKLAAGDNLTSDAVNNIAFGFHNLAERAPVAMFSDVKRGLEYLKKGQDLGPTFDKKIEIVLDLLTKRASGWELHLGEALESDIGNAWEKFCNLPCDQQVEALKESLKEKPGKALERLPKGIPSDLRELALYRHTGTLSQRFLLREIADAEGNETYARAATPLSARDGGRGSSVR
jgi:hypothetical protein